MTSDRSPATQQGKLYKVIDAYGEGYTITA